ncbi:MAG TPA: hypothetical protein VK735_14955 [Pseudonocardia sp.]|jgi:hypothetical protein|uniref:hypothetical protein n=1 Tax=Pseudonocardia sp. TaxID=60912 RepID=UPI002CA75BE6|nr:hypothetical protein [Pseudonocardia sp.]HTF48741.1 hypothetical protein [Pseudonocardia sp.]
MRAPAIIQHLSWHAPRQASRGGSSALTRVATWAIAIEAMLLVGLGVAGLDDLAPPPGLPNEVAAVSPVAALGLRLTPVHSAVLLVTGLLALAALRHQVWRRPFAAAQTVGYLLITVLGLVFQSAGWWLLNPADHVLHASLFLLGLVLLLLLPATPDTPSTSASNATPDV